MFRYSSDPGVDGLPPGEGAFLPCSFWLADNYALLGRYEDARELFDRVRSVQNDPGLLAEEYGPWAGRLVGNFPQALSHVVLINSALNLFRAQARPVTAGVGGVEGAGSHPTARGPGEAEGGP